MKRRTRRTVNFLAFNLLFFSLYLNFIHKDNDQSLQPALVQTTSAAPTQVVNHPVVEKNNDAVKDIN